MKLAASIRSTETVDVKGEGVDVDAARAAALGRMPADHEPVRVTTTRAKSGEQVTVRVTARTTLSRRIESEGASYPEARAALVKQIPPGFQSLGTIVFEG